MDRLAIFAAAIYSADARYLRYQSSTDPVVEMDTEYQAEVIEKEEAVEESQFTKLLKRSQNAAAPCPGIQEAEFAWKNNSD